MSNGNLTTDGLWQINQVNATALLVQQAWGIFNATWMGILATVAVALVLLSTPQQRRGPVFALQCIAFPMALTNTIIVTVCVVFNLRSFFTTRNLSLVPFECAEKAFEAFTPLICDFTLIFKVLAFYPASPLATRGNLLRSRYLAVVPLLVVGLARIVTCTLVTYYYYLYDSTAVAGTNEQIAARGLIYHRAALAEFVLQILYCSYASALLFRKIYLFAQVRQLRRQQGTALLQRRLRYLIESLAMTFTLPVIAQIVAAVSAHKGHGNVLFMASLTNVYLSTLLSVLATSWSTIRLTRVQYSRQTTALYNSRPSSGGSGGHALQGGNASPDGKSGSPKGNGLSALPTMPYTPTKDVISPLSEQLHMTVPYHADAARRAQGYVVGSQGSDGHGQQSLLLASHTEPVEDLGTAHRETLLANLFDDEERLFGHTTSVEMLSTLPPVQSGLDYDIQLPTRGTSGWRRGVLRT